MKAQILDILRSQNEIVSGEALSAAIGISRVSIWKHIHKLQDLGYQIISTPAGYRLERSPDILFPWEYRGDAANILYYPEVTSTMDIARDLARKNCSDLTVVIAGRQANGRGRLNRRWLSDPGGLYFTMVLRPQIPVQLSFQVNFLASLTLARVIREMFQIEAMVKWPNDILVDERKICGMLSELEAEAGAISLKKLMGREVSKKDLLSRFLDAFSLGMQNADFEAVISEWKKYTLTLGRQVRIVTRREQSEGLAVDVDEHGALILELADGTEKKIMYGDCFLI
jgi:BirA family biotin operon repressor/biotin-[acetyl-CoA-carboxylase] ligase